jgi:aminobenzoyl-glutamate utilization protein B
VNTHIAARAPAALDAVCLMYTTSKYTARFDAAAYRRWSINEAILVAGQATADNIAPHVGQIQYACACRRAHGERSSPCSTTTPRTSRASRIAV